MTIEDEKKLCADAMEKLRVQFAKDDDVIQAARALCTALDARDRIIDETRGLKLTDADIVDVGNDIGRMIAPAEIALRTAVKRLETDKVAALPKTQGPAKYHGDGFTAEQRLTGFGLKFERVLGQYVITPEDMERFVAFLDSLVVDEDPVS